MKRLFKQFSFPGGIPSHAAPETPGSIHEGGELGYSIMHACGAVFDNPGLLACCVVGDGEAETGPLATSWHCNKFLNPVRDGAVLPVKSTCHVCHSATGPNPSPDQILKGAIPPLSSLTTRVSLSGFVRKVTSGAPIIMGTPPTYYRGHMPVYVYFSQDEAAAAYLYLIRYPPRP